VTLSAQSDLNQQVRVLFDQNAVVDENADEGLAINIPRKQPQRERTTIHVRVVG
jgi:hypothetical protein